MLKNVAIPLMLAASQAEAQAPSKKELEEAMEQDFRKRVDPLIAPADAAQACTSATTTTKPSGSGNYDLANLSTKITNAETALDTAQKAVAAEKAATGAWAIADKARKEAITAAEAKEADAGIAGKIDALDAALDDERAKAALYWAADKAYQDGLNLKATTAQAASDALTEWNKLDGALTTAKQLVTNVRNQWTKERLNRGWLFCELGADVTLLDSASTVLTWWKEIWSDASTPVQLHQTQPTSCIVPAVTSPQTPQKTYYTAKGTSGQAWENGDDTSGHNYWTAKLHQTEAEAATSSATKQDPGAAQGQGTNRTQKGLVNWHTNDLRKLNWVLAQRTAEKAFWKRVNTAAAAAKTLAAAQTSTTGWETYTIPTNTAGITGNQVTALGLTGSAAGSGKNMKDKETLRNSTGGSDGGSNKVIPWARTQAAAGSDGLQDKSWETVWDVTLASAAANNAGAALSDPAGKAGIRAWLTANGVAANAAPDATSSPASPAQSATYIWWQKAAALSLAINNWYSDWQTKQLGPITIGGSQTITAGGTSPMNNEGPIKDGSDVKECTTSASGWGASSPALSTVTGTFDDLTKQTAWCREKCAAANVTALLDGAAGLTNLGGNTNPKSDANGTGWCGGYSITLGSACKLLSNDDTVTVNTGGTANQGACFKITDVSGLATKQQAVVTALTGVTAGMKTNLKNAADSQAGLEKNYLEAWYTNQYWTRLDHWLNTSTADSPGKVYAGFETDADNAITGARTARNTSQSTLNSESAELAKLDAAVTVAKQRVDDLTERIRRHSTEMANLAALSEANSAGTGPKLDSAGKIIGRLDQQVAEREAERTAYTTNVKTPADTASTNATNAVKAAVVGPPAVAAGQLKTDYDTAKQNWQTATGTVTTKRGDLTTALGNDAAGAPITLKSLRDAVNAKASAWTSANNTLVGLEATVATRTAELATAKKDFADAERQCRVDQYDAYRTTLENAMTTRIENLKKIRTALTTELTRPKRGTAGARCEKALSNGDDRPARNAETVCDTGLCCGAARIPMTSGTTADAGWRTVETCQALATKTYEYRPARDPMATTLPAKKSVAFACIEGAKTLAAAATAAAAAVYMLA